MEFSRCARAGARRTEKSREHSRSLKTQQRDVEVDVVLGESVCRTAEAIDGTDAYRSKALRYP
jgi:hypothetical protein